MRPRGLRTRLTLVVAVGATILISALTLGFNLALRSSLRGDADQVARERAESALETVAVGGNGEVRLIEAPAGQDAGAGVWVFAEGGRALERPGATPGVQRVADSLAGRDAVFADEKDSDTRLYARAVQDQSGAQVGTVVAAVSVEPYERIVREALIASLAFAAVMLVAIIVAARFVLGRALRPVAQMTHEATEWSEHDLDHRFAVGEPYDEITELAAAFDSMLERLSSSLRHEQRLSAEISHELRTPLSAILAETELALAGGDRSDADRAVLERISERATALRRILDALLAAARAEAGLLGGAARVGEAVERVAAEAPPPTAARIDFVASGELDATVDVDPTLLERMLAPVLENAFRYAETRVSVLARRDGSRIAIAVADDGPGVAADEAESIFEPGVRGTAASGAEGDSRSGAGLGLALSRRLTRAAGGDLVLVPGEKRGARFELRLPGA